MKVEEEIWKGEVKSRPKFGEVCMVVQVDMQGGVRMRVEVVYDMEVIGYEDVWVLRISWSNVPFDMQVM
jgi:hypothetical protein